MKKYLLSIIAVVIAVGLSAFTFENKPKAQKTDDVFYWYFVDYTNNSSGEIPLGSSVQFSGTQTHQYAVDNDGCMGSAKDCMRGFSTVPSLPTSSSGQSQTTKN